MEAIKNIFVDQSFYGAILSSIVFILLGFFLRRKEIIKEDGKKAISVIVMNIAIPCMAFSAFMSDFDQDSLVSNMFILGISTLFFIILLLIGNLIFIKKDNHKLYAIFMTIGQLTFFSIPILKAVYSQNISDVIIPSSMITIPFRFFIYIYSYLVISRKKISNNDFGKTMKKIFINPIMIAMILGIFIWISQSFMYKINIDGELYSILRIDKTLPFVYKAIEMGDHLSTPLCMLLIGLTLGESSIIIAVRNKFAWFIASLRTVASPLIVLGLCVLIQWSHIFSFSEYQMSALVIGMAAPVSAVINTYCIKHDNEPYIASDTTLLSTLNCLITIPLLLVIIKLLMTTALFA